MEPEVAGAAVPAIFSEGSPLQNHSPSANGDGGSFETAQLAHS